MITTHRAADRPVDRRPAAVLLAVLLTAAVPLSAERSREQGTVRGSSPSSPPSSGSSGSSGSKSPGRIAVPRSPEGSSGGSSGGRDRERAGRRHHGGHHGGGGYYGGHYGRGYYGYPWYGSYWGVHYGYPWGWWPWYYGAYDSPHYRGYRGGGYYDEADMGALDLDVSPGRTEVHLDGQFLGTVDAFDGWPQYLWLDRGTYDLVLYLDGYRTVAKQITVYPGVVLDVGDRLEPGESVRPEDLVTKTHERRDARLEQDREMRDKAARDRLDERERMEEWRERARERRGAREDDEDTEEVEEVDAVDEPTLGDRDDRGDDGDDDRSLDARGEPGRVRLDVEPGDASIYLDGRFIGTGDDLAKLHSGLLVDAGEHRLAVVRPGRRSEEREFRVAAGQEVELEIELTTN